MKWIIQNNLLAEGSLNEIQNACKDNGIEYKMDINKFVKSITDYMVS